jgi:hypothetical protein
MSCKAAGWLWADERSWLISTIWCDKGYRSRRLAEFGHLGWHQNTTVSILALRPAWPSIQWMPRPLSPDVKRAKRGVDQSHLNFKESRSRYLSPFLVSVSIALSLCMVTSYHVILSNVRWTVNRKLRANFRPFVGAFAKLRKATIRFMSICMSVRMEQLGSHWMDFHEIWYLTIFRKSVEKVSVLLKSDKNNGYLT